VPTDIFTISTYWQEIQTVIIFKNKEIISKRKEVLELHD